MGAAVLVKIAKSLFRDLVIPWIISAICIAVFLVVVNEFGLIAWPICFGIFLYICVLRHPYKNKPGDTSA